jgi:hypothetical protein
MSEILHIGTFIPNYGEISAILFTGGERYYMLIDGNKTVSMMPASTIDEHIKLNLLKFEKLNKRKNNGRVRTKTNPR